MEPIDTTNLSEAITALICVVVGIVVRYLEKRYLKQKTDKNGRNIS